MRYLIPRIITHILLYTKQDITITAAAARNAINEDVKDVMSRKMDNPLLYCFQV